MPWPTPDQLLFSYGTLQNPDVQLDTFGRLVAAEDDVLPGLHGRLRRDRRPARRRPVGPVGASDRAPDRQHRSTRSPARCCGSPRTSSTPPTSTRSSCTAASRCGCRADAPPGCTSRSDRAIAARAGVASSVALSHDDLWPRAGDWPALDDVEGDVDLALIGVPAWRTSLSPTGAHATPAAVRDALRRYSPALIGGPVDLGRAAHRGRRRRRRARRPRRRGRGAGARRASGRRAGAARGRARRRQQRDLRRSRRASARPGSSRSTRTSTCATASRTARRCGG